MNFHSSGRQNEAANVLLKDIIDLDGNIHVWDITERLNVPHLKLFKTYSKH